VTLALEPAEVALAALPVALGSSAVEELEDGDVEGDVEDVEGEVDGGALDDGVVG
jgi:hypothetical protein